MKLLFITQKLHGQDSFAVLWVREFLRQGFDVTVLCLEGSDSVFEFSVKSMGKERGRSKIGQVIAFERLILGESYDRVFIHMAPVYYLLGCWWWILRRIPCYLWYTHYRMQLGVKLFGILGKRFFAATDQSLPQYQGNPKKVIVGHGIDLSAWPERANNAGDPSELLMVHRLSRSKRVELLLRAMKILGSSYSLEIYGIEAEPDYVHELKMLVESLGLSSTVTFHGTVPMESLPEIYTSHRLILNMASETIDKTMLEAMTCGCYPVTTARNARAIGLTDAVSRLWKEDVIPASPSGDTPEAIAAFIQEHGGEPPLPAHEMYKIVRERHSLEGLVKRMGEYIRSGE